MSVRALASCGVAWVCGVLSLGLLPGAAVAEGCSNEQLRVGLSAGLVDCRAYEMVSPVDKNDGAAGFSNSTHYVWESSVDGSRLAYTSTQAFGDARTGATQVGTYLGSRGAGGWSSHSLLPPQAPTASPAPYVSIEAFSGDLSSEILWDGGSGAFLGQDDPPLVSGEPPDNLNLFFGDVGSGSYRLVDVTPPGVTPSAAFFHRASADLSHVVFGEEARLTADAPADGPYVYEWSGGVVSLVNILPGGSAVVGNPFVKAVSEDGSRVVLQGENALYLHEAGVGTVQVDASQGGSGAGGHGVFVGASSDGSRVFFADEASHGLTGDTVPGSEANLYEYDRPGGKLTDLTPDARAEVKFTWPDGLVEAVSRDGSYVYFVADGALAAGAVAGQTNLYVWHDGVTRYITNPQGFYPRAPESPVVSISSDGTRLVFQSTGSLTGYDNTDAHTGEADIEVFIYDAVTGRLVCVSCNPSGVRPAGSSLITPHLSLEEDGLVGYRPRYLSGDGGRLFFNSFDALVPQDTNGREDVYEYEGGHVHLISSGTGDGAQFVDASLSGGDVFFSTTQQLVSQDQDPAFDVYDARVDGGFPPVVSQPGCVGKACRQPASGQAVWGAPGSATFSGGGNLTPPGAVSVVQVKKKPKAAKRKPKTRKRRRRVGKHARGARGAGRGHLTGKRG